MGGHSFAQDQELLHSQALADLRAGLPADDDRFDSRQIAFQILGELPKEQLADDRPQDRVAEEFQALVGGQPMLGPGGMRQRCQQQALILEMIADPRLKLFQERDLLGLGSV